MATVVSYVLISGPRNPDDLAEHPVFDDDGFALKEHAGDASDELSSLTFALTTSLEEKPSLDDECQTLSSEFPEAVVTLCQVEERFDQIEHLRSVVYMQGQQAGEIEHGYVLNVGT